MDIKMPIPKQPLLLGAQYLAVNKLAIFTESNAWHPMGVK